MQSSESRQSKLSENLSEKLVRIDNVVQHQEVITEPKQQQDLGVLTRLSSTPASTLTEDVFGQYWDTQGRSHYIKRFTWRNSNKIEVQVINYGARITSMKFPDRKGQIEDIILGFDDIGGYVYYKNFYLGATIGRVSQIIKDGEFEIDKQRYRLSQNHLETHHKNGGFRGIDQAIWNTFVDGKKVIMSHLSPHMTEGYPGDLLVRITFELSERNEFSIDMEALSTSTTIVNLSNLSYFNLAGHHAGPEEIYKHILTLNCNCFTLQKDGMPTGEIMNVVHSEFDFQVPRLLGKVMGITPKDGFNQNLCVNKGSSQEECFVGRLLHPPSGRMLEIYSNQKGVNFSTANEFGYGRIKSLEEIATSEEKKEDEVLEFLEQLRLKVLKEMHRDEADHYQDLRDFIVRLKISENRSVGNMTPNNSPRVTISNHNLNIEDFIFHPLHVEYLRGFKTVLAKEIGDSYEWFRKTIDTLLDYAILQQSNRASASTARSRPIDIPESVPVDLDRKSEQKKLKERKDNCIPSYYLDTQQVVGKERKIYRMHGGIALQTQNYPNSINFKNFPNCILRPGEKYRHTITYKFWIRAGNPSKWIKRNMHNFDRENNKP